MATKSISLARAQRRRTAGNIQANTDVRSGIWIVHAMHDVRRIPLLGDLRHEHFYFTEGDPDIDTAEYGPPPVVTTLDQLGDEPVRFDAIVTRLDGRRECRRVAQCVLDPTVDSHAQLLERFRVAARRNAGTFVEITSSQLDGSKMRVANWIRVMGAYQRCRQYPLKVTIATVNSRLQLTGRNTLGGLLDDMAEFAPAIVLASVAQLLRRRTLVSDLDKRLWSRHTSLEVAQP